MKAPIYGLMAEFETPEELLEAAHRAHSEGFRNMDAYSPMPIDGLADAIGFRKTLVPLVVLIGGVLGLLTAFGLQYWVNVIAYPLNVGGRPLNSWPAFIIVCFELTILFAGISAVVGTLAMNGLPLPYHPVFNVERFSRVSQDRFFLCIEATDPRFDREHTYQFLAGLRPLAIEEVPN